nr:CoA transferase [Bradyrhizobium jicamae]
MRSSSTEALYGIKVLDLCRVVSGPFATMHLGDLGADVVKIEDPRIGDESRRYGPPFVNGESSYFLSVNRNKRSCAIDLKSAAGRDAVIARAKAADVVIDNFRPGTLAKWGLCYAAMSADNPKLIQCSISGFGRTGPDANRPGYDLILQGESGVMDITGDPDGPEGRHFHRRPGYRPLRVTGGARRADEARAKKTCSASSSPTSPNGVGSALARP